MTRLKVLQLLLGGERNVTELCDLLGESSQPAVSHHLALLRNSRLVVPTRDGKHNFYALTEAGHRVLETIRGLQAFNDEEAIEIITQAADLTRLRLLLRLACGERNVNELCTHVGEASPPSATILPSSGSPSWSRLDLKQA